jgi:hypothetical protein
MQITVRSLTFQNFSDALLLRPVAHFVWPIPEAKSAPTHSPVARASVKVANWLSEGSLVALIQMLAFLSAADD